MSKTKADKQHLSDVASLGCVACRNAGLGPSPSEIHHVRSGAGMAIRHGLMRQPRQPSVGRRKTV